MIISKCVPSGLRGDGGGEASPRGAPALHRAEHGGAGEAVGGVPGPRGGGAERKAPPLRPAAQHQQPEGAPGDWPARGSGATPTRSAA